MSVYILKENFKDDDLTIADFDVSGSLYNQRGYIRRYYAWNETGKLNADLFYNIMEIFYKNWREEYSGLHSLVFGDNLSAHKGTTTIKKMLDHNIFLWFLPENHKKIPLTFYNRWTHTHLVDLKRGFAKFMKALSLMAHYAESEIPKHLSEHAMRQSVDQ